MIRQRVGGVLAARVRRPGPSGDLLRTLASLRGDGPVVAAPDLWRPLVLAPHPDDESLGVGGTLAGLVAAGAEPLVCVVTDGEATPGTGLDAAEVVARRRGEAETACSVLGVGAPVFLHLPDGRVRDHVVRLAAEVVRLVAEHRADGVFAPWLLDGHDDHEAVSRAVALADLPAETAVWAYETWAPLVPNRVVDVTVHQDVKERAVAAHVTAHLSFDIAALVALGRYRSAHGLRGLGHAEAFLVLPHHEHRALAEQLATRS